ncbi:hypothetical protein T4A_7125 [Trichinella pseudospiralis]|uniref:Uncharacterized protein n=1 Tax=Trichinella pseudospiralis TaxID=6337 RepID=A0A0V1K9V0_TRIPS|nr:hypothetical protein T4A_7125 [Trichinella pseudospiralis]KRZ43685.1 hypothetical protein T4C_12369 [Trichinella pseudospiralis]
MRPGDTYSIIRLLTSPETLPQRRLMELLENHFLKFTEGMRINVEYNNSVEELRQLLQNFTTWQLFADSELTYAKALERAYIAETATAHVFDIRALNSNGSAARDLQEKCGLMNLTNRTLAVSKTSAEIFATALATSNVLVEPNCSPLINRLDTERTGTLSSPGVYVRLNGVAIPLLERLRISIASAPNIFQRFMDTLLTHLDVVVPYKLLILIVEDLQCELIEVLREVFNRLRYAGIRLKHKKLTLKEFIRLKRKWRRFTRPHGQKTSKNWKHLRSVKFRSYFTAKKAKVSVAPPLDSGVPWKWSHQDKMAFKRIQMFTQSNSH